MESRARARILRGVVSCCVCNLEAERRVWRNFTQLILAMTLAFLLLSSLASAQDWEVTAEGLLMRRTPTGSQPLTTGVPQGEWNAGDMHFNFELGPRVNLVRNFSDTCSVELTYFGIYDQTAAKQKSTVATVRGPGFTYNNFAARPSRFFYDTNLYSIEVNARHRWDDRTTVLAGVRWVGLSEDFDHVGNVTPVYSLDTNNELYGLQIGAERELSVVSCYALRMSAFTKAGIFNNSADGLATSTGAFGTPTGTATASGDGAAFVGEAGLVGVIPINGWLSMRGCYQVLWLEGIAAAPNQLPNFNTATGNATMNASFSAFYHGGFLALVGEF